MSICSALSESTCDCFGQLFEGGKCLGEEGAIDEQFALRVKDRIIVYLIITIVLLLNF
jgi:hypothetical protein